MDTLDWSNSCNSAFGHPNDLCAFTVQDGPDVCAAAPMIRIGRGLNARLEHAGVSRLYEPTDLVSIDDVSMNRLARALVRSGMPFSLGRLPADSTAIAAVKKACRGRGVVYERKEETYPYIPLGDTWATPEQNISKRRQSDIRRAWRHALKLGPVSVQMFCPTTTEVDEIVDQAMSVEAKSWKGDRGYDMTTDKPIGDFFCQYARCAAASGQLLMSFIHIGDAVAAMQIGVVLNNRFWVLKVGYDPEYQKASPGILLMIETIKYAVARGLQTYELLGTAAEWTRVWTHHERESVSLRVYPANMRGAVAFASDAIAKAKRKLTAPKTTL